MSLNRTERAPAQCARLLVVTIAEVAETDTASVTLEDGMSVEEAAVDQVVADTIEIMIEADEEIMIDATGTRVQKIY